MTELPELKPSKSGRLVDIDGKKRKFDIEKYVALPESGYPTKKFVLQEIVRDNGRRTLRLGYYIIAKKGKRKGKWAWGQFCPFIYKEDFHEIVRRAKEKGIL